jgi:hypothetical protein
MQVSYELHALSKGSWNIERVYNGASKEEALKDARHLYGEPHVTGVKVVCETYNEDTNQSSEAVIYNTTRESGKPVEVKKPAPAQTPAAGPEATEMQGGVARAQPAPAKKPLSTFGLAALSVVLIMAIAVLVIAVTRGAEMLSSL